MPPLGIKSLFWYQKIQSSYQVVAGSCIITRPVPGHIRNFEKKALKYSRDLTAALSAGPQQAALFAHQAVAKPLEDAQNVQSVSAVSVEAPEGSSCICSSTKSLLASAKED